MKTLRNSKQTDTAYCWLLHSNRLNSVLCIQPLIDPSKELQLITVWLPKRSSEAYSKWRFSIYTTLQNNTAVEFGSSSSIMKCVSTRQTLTCTSMENIRVLSHVIRRGLCYFFVDSKTIIDIKMALGCVTVHPFRWSTPHHIFPFFLFTWPDPQGSLSHYFYKMK